MQLPYHSVILSNAKDLNTSTSAFQILHFVQNDTTKRKWMCIMTHPPYGELASAHLEALIG